MTLTALMLLATTQLAVAQSGEIERILAKHDAIKYSHQHGDFYRSLFAVCEPFELVALHSNASDSIATQSAWETVALTVAKEGGTKVYRPDAAKLAWFVGFFEGRNRVTVPDWWRTVVVDARVSQRNDIYPVRPKERPYHRSGVEGVACPTNATVTERNHVVTYRTGNDSIALPEELLDRADDGDLWCDMSCAFTKEHCFAAIHGDAGYPHDVACIDRKTGKIIWKSEVCGCWWGGTSGMHESWVAVVPTGDGRIFVFGCAAAGFYAHGFDASTGRTLVRFSNNY